MVARHMTCDKCGMHKVPVNHECAIWTKRRAQDRKEAMNIDTKRLATDAAYWDEIKGAIGGTHYDKETGFFCDEKGYYSEHGFKPWIRINPLREQPDRFIPRHHSEWVDGLPPVGTECEVVDDGSLVYGQGESGECIAHVENTAVIRMSYGLGCFEARFLKAFRTKAQRDRDDLSDLIHSHLGPECNIEAATDAILSRYNLEPKP